MKVTIDVPAPHQSLELISRLRQKVRNYKTSMKQLQRAHFITKALYERQQEREAGYQYTIRTLIAQNNQLHARIETLENAYDEALAISGRPVEGAPVEDRNQAEGEALVFCDNEACAIVHTHQHEAHQEYEQVIAKVAGNGNGAAHRSNGLNGAA